MKEQSTYGDSPSLYLLRDVNTVHQHQMFLTTLRALTALFSIIPVQLQKADSEYKESKTGQRETDNAKKDTDKNHRQQMKTIGNTI